MALTRTQQNSLAEFRKKWEGQRPVLVFIDQTETHGRVLVIQEERDGYRLLRYVQSGKRWDVSVDSPNAPLAQVWQWLNRPEAIPREE